MIGIKQYTYIRMELIWQKEKKIKMQEREENC